MEDILQNITAKAATIVGIKYSDENWGQIQYYGMEPTVKWPCILVELGSGQFSNNGYDYMNDDLSQQGTISIEITVADVKLTNSSTRAPINQKKKAFSIWKLVDDVHKELQGFKPVASAGGMVRTSMQSVKRDDGVQEKRIIYTIGLSGC